MVAVLGKRCVLVMMPIRQGRLVRYGMGAAVVSQLAQSNEALRPCTPATAAFVAGGMTHALLTAAAGKLVRAKRTPKKVFG